MVSGFRSLANAMVQLPISETLTSRPSPTTASTSKSKSSKEGKQVEKKQLDRAQANTRLNIRAAFQRWRKLYGT